jgi:lysophospholipase L1-like esterase
MRSGPPHRLRAGPLLAAVALIALFAACSPAVGAERARAASRTRASAATAPILLALGDSLAAGYQPIDGEHPPPVDPQTGLADAGYPHGYAQDLASELHLRLIDLACPGETTTSFTTHAAQGACTNAYREIAGARNQLGAALAVLDAHRGQVGLVTFDLGANDVDTCEVRHSLDTTCLLQAIAGIDQRLPSILATLSSALHQDDPGARFVAMTYYDPFLGLAYDPGGLRASALAIVSLGGLSMLNAALTALYRKDHILVAPVAAAFASGAILPLQRYGGRLLPRDVATVCRLTYMCPLPGRPGEPAQDIHPNTKGYGAIAHAFETVLDGSRPQQA